MDQIGGEVPWRRTGYFPNRLLLLLSMLTKRTSLLKNSLVELDKRGEMEVQCRRRRSHENDGFKRAGVCPIGLRIPGGTGSPGTFLPASARSPGSLVCLRAGARVLCDGGTTVH